MSELWVIETFLEDEKRWEISSGFRNQKIGVILASAFYTRTEAERALELRPDHRSKWQYRIVEYRSFHEPSADEKGGR